MTSSGALYTLGPALRIPDIKNMGRDLALEELRISHDCPVGHGDQSKFWIFRCKNVKILDKNCALRAPRTTGSTTDIVISPTDAKSDEPAKMTHSISDFWGRLQA